MNAQVAADLRAAADVLERDGWTPGAYHDDRGCHCAEGAIAYAIGQHIRADDIPEDGLVYLDWGWWSHPDETLWERRTAAEIAVKEWTDSPSVISWNDTEGRTAAEVIAALRAAADRAEADQ